MRQKNQWLDIVFEGRNKAYGAYELRSQTENYYWALIIGAIFLVFLLQLLFS
jgi:protein TonB